MRKPSFVSVLVWINGGVPAVLLLNDAFHHRLGANPVNFALLTTGLLALIFLMLSLSVTPVRQIAHWDAPFPARRNFGLWAAIYAFAHFFIFFWWDRERSVSSTVHEILVRKYLWFGTAALVIFIPLTLTSTRGWIRRLGGGWKWLHRLVYLAAIGAVVHYMMQGKVVTPQSIVFALIVGALLLYRIVASEVRLRLGVRAAKSNAARGFAITSKPKFWRGQLKVIKTFDETPEVRTFRLAPIEGLSLPFDYKPGQYLNLMLTVDGRPVNRSYTIASSPSRLGYCELTVKREEMGTSSRHLHREIQAGDKLNISAPAGKFVFDGTTGDSIVMIAGGVGVTPLMSKVRYLTDLAWAGDIYFIFSARAESDIIFGDELEFLAKRHHNLHITVTLTRADSTWKGERGRITPELLNRVVPEITNRLVHICGPTQMADATSAMLITMGVPATNIKMESFTSPKPSGGSAAMSDVVKTDDVQAQTTDTTHTLTFEISGKTQEVPGEQVILEAAEAAGVSIEYDCRSGICGTCKVKLISGKVLMAVEDALNAGDRADGIILACQARCTEDVTIEA